MHRLILAAAFVCSAGVAPAASFTVFQAFDAGATSRAAAPLATAAETAFLTALSSVQTADFEGLTSLSSAVALTDGDTGIAGFTMTATDLAGTDDVQLNNPGNGFNTTPGGSRYLTLIEIGPGEPATRLSFDFATPITAFGLMLPTRVTRDDPGRASVRVGGRTFALTNADGLQFFGVTTNMAVSQVVLGVTPTATDNEVYLGIDDVRLGTVAAAAEAPPPAPMPPVPLPPSILLLTAGLAGLAAFMRGGKARRQAPVAV